MSGELVEQVVDGSLSGVKETGLVLIGKVNLVVKREVRSKHVDGILNSGSISTTQVITDSFTGEG